MGADVLHYEDVKTEVLKDPEVQRFYNELEPAYQVASLRILRGLTQQQLAEQVGTTQSSIARLESGKTKPSISFLERVVAALGGQLTITIEPSSG
jgi:DNA-binding XRE family transcriptional regulator